MGRTLNVLEQHPYFCPGRLLGGRSCSSHEKRSYNQLHTLLSLSPQYRSGRDLVRSQNQARAAHGQKHLWNTLWFTARNTWERPRRVADTFTGPKNVAGYVAHSVLKHDVTAIQLRTKSEVDCRMNDSQHMQRLCRQTERGRFIVWRGFLYQLSKAGQTGHFRVWSKKRHHIVGCHIKSKFRQAVDYSL